MSGVESRHPEDWLDRAYRDLARVRVLLGVGEYKTALQRRDELALRLEEARVEADALRDRLSVILAAMRAEEM